MLMKLTPVEVSRHGLPPHPRQVLVGGVIGKHSGSDCDRARQDSQRRVTQKRFIWLSLFLEEEQLFIELL